MLSTTWSINASQKHDSLDFSDTIFLYTSLWITQLLTQTHSIDFKDYNELFKKKKKSEAARHVRKVAHFRMRILHYV